MNSEENRTTPNADSAQAKDAPLQDDIRLLGRVLGETVRAQEGDAVFELIEVIRRNSVKFHRHDDAEARQELEKTLEGLSAAQAVQVIRAFSSSAQQLKRFSRVLSLCWLMTTVLTRC